MNLWQRIRHASFHNIVNRFAGTMMVLLGLLYSFPSESSVQLGRVTHGVLSVGNFAALFILCGLLLLARHWKPFVSIAFTLPAFALAVFNTYFLVDMLLSANVTLLIRPVWPPAFYFGFIPLFWLCKVYEFIHAPTAARQRPA